MTMAGCGSSGGGDGSADAPKEVKKVEIKKFTKDEVLKAVDGKKLGGVEVKGEEIHEGEFAMGNMLMKNQTEGIEFEPKECDFMLEMPMFVNEPKEDEKTSVIVGPEKDTESDKLAGLVYNTDPSEKIMKYVDDRVAMEGKCNKAKAIYEGDAKDFSLKVSVPEKFAPYVEKSVQWEFKGKTDGEETSIANLMLILNNGAMVGVTTDNMQKAEATATDFLKALGVETP